jgi:hypothetical protein
MTCFLLGMEVSPNQARQEMASLRIPATEFGYLPRY